MITNNIDLIVAFDGDHLVATTRIFPAEAPAGKEHAGQCCMIEHVREILASGITLAEWNSTAEPWTYRGQTWEDYWAGVRERAHVRACLNVSADIPHLTTPELDQISNMASNFFEQGYAGIMAATQQDDKITFTRTGGI
jgi:hypothetical protein